MKNFIQKVLLLIGIIIFIIFVKNINFKIISLSINSIGIIAIIVLLLYIASSIIVKAIRWKFMLEKIANTKIGLGFSAIANLAGIAGASLMPGRIDLVKPLMMKTNYGIKMSQSLSAITMERALDLLTLLLIAAVSLFFIPVQNVVKIYLIFLFIATVILTMFLLVYYPILFMKIILLIPLPKKLKGKFEEFTTLLLQGFSSLKSKNFVLLMLLLSFLAMGLEVLRFYFLMYFLGIPVTVAITGFTLAVAVIIGVLTMIPGGVGITEHSAAGILAALLTSPAELVKSAVLIDRFIAYYILLLIGSVILLSYAKVHKSFKENK